VLRGGRRDETTEPDDRGDEPVDAGGEGRGLILGAVTASYAGVSLTAAIVPEGSVPRTWIVTATLWSNRD